jgi:hypothetical protein
MGVALFKAHVSSELLEEIDLIVCHVGSLLFVLRKQELPTTKAPQRFSVN